MVPINGLDRASSFDFHYSESEVYFSDSLTDSASFSQSFKIRRANILEKTVHLEDFLTQGMVKVNTIKRIKLSPRSPHHTKYNSHLFLVQSLLIDCSCPFMLCWQINSRSYQPHAVTLFFYFVNIAMQSLDFRF